MPVPTSPVMTMKPPRSRRPNSRWANASACFFERYRYFGSGVRLKGFSWKPYQDSYTVVLRLRSSSQFNRSADALDPAAVCSAPRWTNWRCPASTVRPRCTAEGRPSSCWATGPGQPAHADARRARGGARRLGTSRPPLQLPVRRAGSAPAGPTRVARVGDRAAGRLAVEHTGRAASCTAGARWAAASRRRSSPRGSRRPGWCFSATRCTPPGSPGVCAPRTCRGSPRRCCSSRARAARVRTRGPAGERRSRGSRRARSCSRRRGRPLVRRSQALGPDAGRRAGRGDARRARLARPSTAVTRHPFQEAP